MAILRKGVKIMEKIVKFQSNSRWEKIREEYKEDFRKYVTKREAEDNTIHFRNFDNRERM